MLFDRPAVARLLLAPFFLGLSTIAAAQNAPPPPDVATPTREELEVPRPDGGAARSRVEVDSDGAIERGPCPLEGYDLRTTITSIRFEGPASAGLAPEIVSLLAPVAADPPAGEQQIAVICDIRDRANAQLRQAGYVASVQIPPQQLESGELRLEVVTARIVEVRVRGTPGPYQDTLDARIAQLKALDPLNEHEAERVLLLASDIPGLEVQLALRPAGTAPGEVIGDLNVVYQPFSIIANVQNFGSRQLGRETGFVIGEVYGLTGYADRTYVGASTTLDFEEQHVLLVGHSMGLGPNGLALEGGFTYAWSKPDIGVLDLRSESLIANVELAMPLVRSLSRNFSVGGGLELIEQRTRIFGTGDEEGAPLIRDKLRVAYLRAEGGLRELRPAGGEAWSLRGELEARQGLDILDASQQGTVEGGFQPSRFEGDPTATVFRGELEGAVGIGPVFQFYAAGRGQWSSDPLLNFEEFSLGNLTIGRGYDPGANSADRAVALRGEARAKVFNQPNFVGELFAFYDSVWIWNRDTNAIENDRRLGSYGGGLRLTVQRRAFLEAIYARPEHVALILPGATRPPDRVLLSLTVQFAPEAR